MEAILNCVGIEKEFGDKTLLQKIDFHIGFGEKAALVGVNGAGKSTLANIVFGSVKADKGNIIWYKKQMKIGYLHQSMAYTERGLQEESLEYNEKYYNENLYKITSHLGLEDVKNWEEERFNNLSGGEKMKVALANIWAREPDFLILDEPTNHLDYKGIQWLIEELKKYKGTILVISHDRYFLDKVVHKIIEIEQGESAVYYGNYSFYKEEKRRRFESHLRQYEAQEKYKQKINEEIEKLKNWSDKAHGDSRAKERAGLGKKEFFRMKAKKKDKQIKSRIKRLEKIDLEGVKKPEEDQKINFNFGEGLQKGNRLIEAREIKKSFGEKILFKNSSFYIKRGERIALFGGNGCGKTTLLNIILGKEPLDEGDIFVSSGVNIGYLSQETIAMDKNIKLIEYFDFTSREEQGKIRILLANLGFYENVMEQPLYSLSEGELTRVRMAKLILKGWEMLILDEPINHLDIYSREKLEEALKEYEGTIILVSHDRYMIEKLCEGLLVFEDNKIIKVLGEPKEYLHGLINQYSKRSRAIEKTKEESLKEINEEKMLIDNEIAFILGEINKFSAQSEEYKSLDKKFNELIKRKRELNI